MKTDIDELLARVDTLLSAAVKVRGNAQDLVKAAPLEIHFYNIATGLKSELEGFKALLEDAQGTYLKRP